MAECDDAIKSACCEDCEVQDCGVTECTSVIKESFNSLCGSFEEDCVACEAQD